MADPAAPVAAPVPSDAMGGTWSMLVAWWSQNPWIHHVAAALATLLIASLIWLVISRTLGLLLRRVPSLAHYEFHLMRVARWLFWAMAVILTLQQAGVDTDNLWTTLMTMAAMVAIGFIAVWSLLSNLVASVLILATRLFKPKDDIELMDTPGGVSVRGTVRSVDMMFTTVEEVREDGTTTVLKVPNNLFFQKVVRIRGG
jgi:small-conductance mechanosensitive channel